MGPHHSIQCQGLIWHKGASHTPACYRLGSTRPGIRSRFDKKDHLLLLILCVSCGQAPSSQEKKRKTNQTRTKPQKPTTCKKKRQFLLENCSSTCGIWQDKHRLREQNLEEAQENLPAHGWDV